jgi:hypothetical protein
MPAQPHTLGHCDDGNSGNLGVGIDYILRGWRRVLIAGVVVARI